MPLNRAVINLNFVKWNTLNSLSSDLFDMGFLSVLIAVIVFYSGFCTANNTNGKSLLDNSKIKNTKAVSFD